MTADGGGDQTPGPAAAADGFRSGFVTFVGRPNAGKSTLINRICGEKVSITSNKPQTTRTRVMGVCHRPGAQLVVVDTPGIHKPVTALGERLNQTATAALEVDVACLVIDATAPVGTGDAFVADHLPPGMVVVVTKTDIASPAQIARQLAAVGERFDADEVVPLSGRTGDGVELLVDRLIQRLAEGPAWFPAEMVTDAPEAFRVAELVREQLLRRVHEELPYSIATRCVEWRWPYVKVEVLVERDSQKGMVIGRKAKVIKSVGEAVRKQLPDGTYLDLQVKVARDWQRRPHLVDRLVGPDPDAWDVGDGADDAEDGPDVFDEA